MRESVLADVFHQVDLEQLGPHHRGWRLSRLVFADSVDRIQIPWEASPREVPFQESYHRVDFPDL